MSSQAYMDSQDEDNSNDFVGTVVEDEVVGNSDDDGEADLNP